MPAQSENLTTEAQLRERIADLEKALAAATAKRAKRAKKEVEPVPFIEMVGRMIRAAGRRAGESDGYSLAALVNLSGVLTESIDQAALSLHGEGYSWGDIAKCLGVSRQRAQQRWAHLAVGVSVTGEAEGVGWVEPALPLVSQRRRRR